MLKITLKGSEIAKADRRIDLWAMIPAVAKNSGLLKNRTTMHIIAAFTIANLEGRNWLPVLEMHLTVGQKGKNFFRF